MVPLVLLITKVSPLTSLVPVPVIEMLVSVIWAYTLGARETVAKQTTPASLIGFSLN